MAQWYGSDCDISHSVRGWVANDRQYSQEPTLKTNLDMIAIEQKRPYLSRKKTFFFVPKSAFSFFNQVSAFGSKRYPGAVCTVSLPGSPSKGHHGSTTVKTFVAFNVDQKTEGRGLGPGLSGRALA